MLHAAVDLGDKRPGQRSPFQLHRIRMTGNSIERHRAVKQFTFSDMNRASEEILEAALVEPVTLTKRGKEKLVSLPLSNTVSSSVVPTPLHTA